MFNRLRQASDPATPDRPGSRACLRIREQTIKVHESKLKRVIKHQKYNPSDYSNDIALAELENCVPDFNQFRSPICLPTGKYERYYFSI